MKTSISRSFVCVVTIFVMLVGVAGVANAQPASDLDDYFNRAEQRAAENKIITAVKEDDLNAVVECVTKDRTLINTVDDSEDGQTLVHLAVKAENPTVLKCLIAWDANLKTRDKNGKTPLKVAVEAKNIEAVRYLWANGATREGSGVTEEELDALPFVRFEHSQYIVEKSEEVKQRIAEEQAARDAATQQAADEDNRRIAKEKEDRIKRENAARIAAEEAAKEKERQRKEAVAEFHRIVTPAVLIQLTSNKNGERELAFNTLKDKFIVNRVGQRYEFSIKILATTIDESFGVDATEKADITKKLNALQRMGKYLESEIKPSVYDELEKKDIFKKMLALDAGVVKMLPDIGAKIIIHGVLFNRDPENKACKFGSDEFNKFCDYLKTRQSELTPFRSTLEGDWSASEYVLAAKGDTRVWRDTGFEKIYVYGDNRTKNIARKTGITDQSVTDLVSGRYFIFDTIKAEGVGSYALSRIDPRCGRTSGTQADKNTIDTYLANENPYLKTQHFLEYIRNK